jgi:hypothetical protein
VTTTEAGKTDTKNRSDENLPFKCSLTAANTVLYDNLTLKDVSGKLIVKDEKLTMEDIKRLF